MGAGINETNVTRWMCEALGLEEPLNFALIAGGRSNLTFRVRDASGRTLVLRRPPTSHVLPTAHDMVREYTILSALFPTGLPVPEALALCRDETVNDYPFYVMTFVDGAILRNREDAEATYSEGARSRIGMNLARTLSELHALDVEEIGLGALARHDGYIERQLRRWRGQFEQMSAGAIEPEPLVLELADELARSIPRQQRVSVVHGDYRLDNTVLDDRAQVKAILDWEICTLGDPMADLGTLLCYWAEPADPTAALLGAAPTTASGFVGRAEVLAHYAANSDLDVSDAAYYQAFGYWKLACIMQGVFARYRAGATAGDRGSVEDFPEHITMLAETAKRTLEY